MRIATLLLTPTAMVLLLIAAAPRLVAKPEVPSAWRGDGLVWADRVFTSKGQFAAWLDRRGHSYAQWRRRHPRASPWEAASGNASSAAAAQSRSTGGDDGRGWAWPAAIVVALAAAMVLLIRLCARAAERVETTMERLSRERTPPPRTLPRGPAAGRISAWLDGVDRPRVALAAESTLGGAQTAGGHPRPHALASALAYAGLRTVEVALYVAPFMALLVLILTVPVLL